MFEIAELAKKYRLPERQVKESVKQSISESLSQAMGLEVETHINGHGLKMYSYRYRNGVPTQEEIDPGNLKKPIIRHLRLNIANKLETLSVLYAYQFASAIRHTLVEGTIRKKDEDTKTIHIDLALENSIGAYESVTAVCGPEGQPQHERNSYRLGQTMWWYVSKVEAVRTNGVPVLDISLSRRSAQLPALLLKKRYEETSTIPCDFTCIRRIPGAFSKMLLTRRIPKEIITSVVKELGEQLHIKIQNTV